MSEINKARKEDVYQVAYEMNLDVQPSMKLVQLRELIKSSPLYEEEFVNCVLKNQIAAREEKQAQEALEEKRKQEALEEKRKQEALEEKRRQEALEEKHRQEALEEKRRQEQLDLEKRKLEINFELEKLKLQAQSQLNSGGAVGGNSAESSFPESKVDVKRLLPTFDADVDDITLFLVLLERQLKLLKVPERLWVSHLLSVVPSSISTLIARESEENASDFSFVKKVLLKRFKISAEKCRQLFFDHRKIKGSTWKDYYFELLAYYENWLTELNIETFEDLKHLFIADQMKRRVSFECKENMLDVWESLNSPEVLADKLDAYESIRSTFSKKEPVVTSNRKGYFPQESYQKTNKPYVSNKMGAAPITPTGYKQNQENKIVCYGCGKPGVIKRKCSNCSGDKTKSVEARQLLFYSCNASGFPALNIPITVCNKEVLVCADTGATRSIAGERMFKLFKESGIRFRTEKHDVTLADGVTHARETLSAVVPVTLKGTVVETEFLILPNAKGNRTLLGLDFLQKSKVVLDIAQNSWYISDKPENRYQFVNEYDLLNNVPVAKVEINPYALRNDEGKTLTPEQRNQFNSLLKNYEKCFHPGGGGATPYTEHRINTGDNALVSGTDFNEGQQQGKSNGDVVDQCGADGHTATATKSSEEDKKLFIGGISRYTNQKDLKEYFTKFGEVTEVNIKTDPFSGRSRGFAFVAFRSRDSVDSVLRNGPYTIKGKQIEAKRAKVRTGNKKIFVGGIESGMTEADIRNYFERHGRVESVELPFDKVKNQRRQFCFVTFEHEMTVDQVCKQPKQTIGNKECDVKKVTPLRSRGRPRRNPGSLSGRRQNQRGRM